MKLYYFNPNDWGAQYFVMAENKIDAHKYLLVFLEKRMEEPKEKCYIYANIEELERWKLVNPLDPSTFSKTYKLDEYDVGQVVESENA